MAAIDFLGLHDSVDREKLGIIGICGFGGMALNADWMLRIGVALLVLAIARLGTGEEVEALDHADTYEELSDSEEAVHMDEEHNEEYDHEESDEDALRRAQNALQLVHAELQIVGA